MQSTTAFAPYFSNCFLASYLYLRIPRDETGPIMTYVLHQDSHSNSKKVVNFEC